MHLSPLPLEVLDQVLLPPTEGLELSTERVKSCKHTGDTLSEEKNYPTFQIHTAEADQHNKNQPAEIKAHQHT